MIRVKILNGRPSVGDNGYDGIVASVVDYCFDPKNRYMILESNIPSVEYSWIYKKDCEILEDKKRTSHLQPWI